MLDREGTISFVSEIMTAVDSFLADYERVKGPLRNDLERGLVISYVLGVMHCDLEAVWEAMGQSPIFGSLHPRAVFEDCADQDAAIMADRGAFITQELGRRGWVPPSQE